MPDCFPSNSSSLRRWLVGGALLLAITLIAACTYQGNLGQVSCDSDDDCQGSSICASGYCVEHDAGVDDPTDTDAPPDVPCDAETDQQFCDNHQVACGSFTGTDTCGDERLVDCGQFDGFSCGEYEECILAQESDDLDANTCRCPSIDDAQQICQILEAECGDVDAGQACAGWDEFDTVSCGSCDGDEECGVAGENICGCPCTIADDNGDGCYGDGDVDPDDQCAVCDPDESETEFTPATGISCDTTIDGAQATCQSGDCVPTCLDADEEICGTGDNQICVDTTSSDDHCGDCDTQCGTNESCVDGDCVCDDAQCAPDVECGSVTNTCGNSTTCGTCGTDESCNTNNQCVCDDAQCALDDECGTVTNACGDTTSCGTCDTDESCDTNNNQCICDDAQCGSFECGTVTNACGDTTTCGTCGTDETCNAGVCECDNQCCGNDDCGADEICDGGVCECAEECCGDGDCTGNQGCSTNNTCLLSCNNDNQCSDNGDAVICGSEDLCVECEDDEDCGTDEECDAGLCVDN